MLIVGNHHLLADAKIPKYIPQHLIISYFPTNDFCQMEQTFP